MTPVGNHRLKEFVLQLRRSNVAVPRWATAHPGHMPVSVRRACLVTVGLVLAVLLLAACGGSSSGSAGSITLYNGQHEQTTDSLVAGFEKATGITVNVRSDDEDTLADELVTDGANSPADVIFTETNPAAANSPRTSST